MVKIKTKRRIEYKGKSYGRGSIIDVPEGDMHKFAHALAWDSVRIVDEVKEPMVKDLPIKDIVKSSKKTKGRRK